MFYFCKKKRNIICDILDRPLPPPFNQQYFCFIFGGTFLQVGGSF
jgi:hypothetical protein